MRRVQHPPADFAGELASNNVVFSLLHTQRDLRSRLVENVPDSALEAALAAICATEEGFGASPDVSSHGNDGTITKVRLEGAEQSLRCSPARPINVEMGVTNEIFPNEAGE